MPGTGPASAPGAGSLLSLPLGWRRLDGGFPAPSASRSAGPSAGELSFSAAGFAYVFIHPHWLGWRVLVLVPGLRPSMTTPHTGSSGGSPALRSLLPCPRHRRGTGPSRALLAPALSAAASRRPGPLFQELKASSGCRAGSVRVSHWRAERGQDACHGPRPRGVMSSGTWFALSFPLVFHFRVFPSSYFFIFVF